MGILVTSLFHAHCRNEAPCGGGARIFASRSRCYGNRWVELGPRQKPARRRPWLASKQPPLPCPVLESCLLPSCRKARGACEQILTGFSISRNRSRVSVYAYLLCLRALARVASNLVAPPVLTPNWASTLCLPLHARVRYYYEWQQPYSYRSRPMIRSPTCPRRPLGGCR